MLKKLIILAFSLFVFVNTIAFGQQKHAYKIFDTKGIEVSYFDMLEKAAVSDMVFFGELHNNPIAHWLQIELTRDLFDAKAEKLILGAEMFESDDQLILNEYLNGLISERNFKAETKIWSNYDTDYSPLVIFAKENNLRFVATNIPRRYASMVHKGGFDALENISDEAKELFAELPIPYDPELPGYKAMLEMKGMQSHGNPNLPKAQAMKDATMTHFILKNYKTDDLFLHFNGAYHTNNFEGIIWYLLQAGKEDGFITISLVEQENLDNLEENNFGLASFIIVVPPTMTKTH